MRQNPPAVYSVSYAPEFEEDLEAVYAVDHRSGDEIVAFLEQATASQALLDRFSDTRFRSPDDPQFDVKVWGSMWRDFALWRVKLVYTRSQASTFRIVYTFVPAEKRYYFLAIAPKANFNYDDPADPVCQRIANVYRRLTAA